jgi:TRAP-type C4-dicarboxylate transport system permease small subunit
MKTLLFLLFIILVGITTVFHLYSSWKNEDKKVMFIQMGILGLAIVLGGVLIYEIQLPTLSKLFNIISPF